jgi:hypothetical protein
MPAPSKTEVARATAYLADGLNAQQFPAAWKHATSIPWWARALRTQLGHLDDMLGVEPYGYDNHWSAWKISALLDEKTTEAFTHAMRLWELGGGDEMRFLTGLVWSRVMVTEDVSSLWLDLDGDANAAEGRSSRYPWTVTEGGREWLVRVADDLEAGELPLAIQVAAAHLLSELHHTSDDTSWSVHAIPGHALKELAERIVPQLHRTAQAFLPLTARVDQDRATHTSGAKCLSVSHIYGDGLDAPLDRGHVLTEHVSIARGPLPVGMLLGFWPHGLPWAVVEQAWRDRNSTSRRRGGNPFEFDLYRGDFAPLHRQARAVLELAQAAPNRVDVRRVLLALLVVGATPPRVVRAMGTNGRPAPRRRTRTENVSHPDQLTSPVNPEPWMSHPNPMVRRTAILTLTSHVAELEGVLDDPHPWVKDTARTAVLNLLSGA